ncbi:hypothetical protein L7F22_004701 [Adiantum nelumboides]|nr:hypothetical protein [Adiantum nelumboides]
MPTLPVFRAQESSWSPCIRTHARAGYGSRAIECLRAYYAGELFDADSAAAAAAQSKSDVETFASVRDRATDGALQEEKNSIAIRDGAKMPALLERLSDKQPEAALDWLGVSYGFTPALFRSGREMVRAAVRAQTQNELTGEYTAVMVRGVDKAEKPRWLGAFAADFRRRFISLLGFRFRDVNGCFGAERTGGCLFWSKVCRLCGNNMVDYTVVLDLLHTLASLYFNNRLFAAATEGEDEAEEGIKAQLKLSGIQAATLLALGLQRKDPNDIERSLAWPTAQALALFVKAVRRITACLQRVEKAHYAKELQANAASRAGPTGRRRRERGESGEPIQQSVERSSGRRASSMSRRKRREEQRELLKSMDLDQYAHR